MERTQGQIHVFSGTDDQMWPSTRYSDAVVARLAAHEHPFPFAHHRYQGAGHQLRAPGLPTAVVNPTMALGGTQDAQAAANRDAWSQVLRALENRAHTPSPGAGS